MHPAYISATNIRSIDIPNFKIDILIGLPIVVI